MANYRATFPSSKYPEGEIKNLLELIRARKIKFAQHILECKRNGMPVSKKDIRKILGMPEGPYYDGDYVVIEYPSECAMHYIATCRLNGEDVSINRLRAWAL